MITFFKVILAKEREDNGEALVRTVTGNQGKDRAEKPVRMTPQKTRQGDGLHQGTRCSTHKALIGLGEFSYPEIR